MNYFRRIILEMLGYGKRIPAVTVGNFYIRGWVGRLSVHFRVSQNDGCKCLNAEERNAGYRINLGIGAKAGVSVQSLNDNGFYA